MIAWLFATGRPGRIVAFIRVFRPGFCLGASLGVAASPLLPLASQAFQHVLRRDMDIALHLLPLEIPFGQFATVVLPHLGVPPAVVHLFSELLRGIEDRTGHQRAEGVAERQEVRDEKTGEGDEHRGRQGAAVLQEVEQPLAVVVREHREADDGRGQQVVMVAGQIQVEEVEPYQEEHDHLRVHVPQLVPVGHPVVEVANGSPLALVEEGQHQEC